jgi:hypothetical protein
MSQHDFDYMLLEGYIHFLKNQLSEIKAVDPYAIKFAQAFPSRSPLSMRDFKHLTNLIKVSALFHFAQRPLVIRKIKPETAAEDPAANEKKEIEERYIMVTRHDYDFIMALWNNIQETTETSAPGHIIKFYHEAVEDAAKETCPHANISPSTSEASLIEKSPKVDENGKINKLRNFKTVYWSDGYYGWHTCAVCGYTKLTSWQAENFKDEKVWLCEDCKEAWEKQQAGDA